ALDSTRTELSAHAPRIETLQIDKAKIREVIGTGGKVIREIVATTGAKVDIDDEGLIKISSSDVAQIEAARQWIIGITQEAEVGKVYDGKVVNMVDFGAFVNFMGGKDGLVHVSEIRNERTEKVTDVLSEGQAVKVKVLEIDPRGKVRLSMRVVDQETGAELEDTRPAREERPRGDRPERSDRGPRRDGDGGRGPRRDGDGGRGPRREGGGGGDRAPRAEGERAPRAEGGDRAPREGGGGYGGGRAAKQDDDNGPAPEFAPAFLTRED
ncbi:MAG: pnp, partial [Sphingomonadales bacterium]|nr:pnp [Sphingomonadales bacterium]